MQPWAEVGVSPMARSTWEGSREPEEQADPVDAQIPSASRDSKMDSPSTNSKLMLLVFGRRGTALPFTVV